jgi:hypothetical protein
VYENIYRNLNWWYLATVIVCIGYAVILYRGYPV